MTNSHSKTKKKPPIVYEYPTQNEIFSYLNRNFLPRTRLNISRAKKRLRRIKGSKPKQDYNTFSVSQSDADYQIVYGQRKIGGTFAFIHSTDSNQYLHLVVILAGHEIESVEKVYFDSTVVTFDGSDNATGRYAGYVTRQINYGSDGQSALSKLVTNCPSKWTSNHRLRGLAHIYLRLKYNKNLFPNGLPELSFEIKGKKVYDPRDASTAYSNNAVLCTADYLMNTKHGLSIASGEIDMDNLEDAADICDEQVDLITTGTESRYTANLVFGASENPHDILDKFNSSMGGNITWINGLWKIYPAAWRAPTLSLDENDIISSIRVQTKISRRDNFNSVKGTYFSSQNRYEETDYPPVRNATYRTQDNNEEVYEEISLPATTSSATAQRLAKIELERVRQPITVELTATLKAYQAEPPDVIQLSVSRLGWTNKYFEIEESELIVEEDDQGVPFFAVQLSLRETASGVYDWNHGEETRVDVAPNTDLPDAYSVETISGLTLESGTNQLFLRNDGTVFTAIKVSWTALTDFFVSSGGAIEIQYKKSADSDWISSTNVQGDSDFTRILDVEDGAYYDVRVRAKSAVGVLGDWTTYEDYLVIGKTEAPSNVDGLVAVAGSFGIRANWNAIADVDVAYYLVKIGSAGGSWDDATTLQEVRGTSLVVDLKTAGTYKLQIKAVDTSGNFSEVESTANVTIAAPSAPTITSTIDSENLVLKWTESTGDFAVSNYDISYGSTYGSSTALATIKGTTYRLKVLFGGSRTFWIAARDVAGNLGTPGRVDVLITTPGAVVGISSDVIDNNVLLKWSAPSTGTIPIDYYKVYKGDIFATAELVGQVGGTFQALFEIVAGNYTYWVVPYDKAGNSGVETGVPATVNQPPDFELLDDQIMDLTGGVSALMLEQDGDLYGPIYINETFEDHFINNGWTSPQDQIDDGWDYYLQPNPEYAYWQDIIDYGTIIPGTLVDVSFLQTNIVGSLTVSVILSTSLDEVSWTEFEGATFYLTNFRYLRVRIEIGDYPFSSGQAMGVLGLTYA